MRENPELSKNKMDGTRNVEHEKRVAAKKADRKRRKRKRERLKRELADQSSLPPADKSRITVLSDADAVGAEVWKRIDEAGK